MTIARAALKAYAMLAIVMLLWAGNTVIGRAIRDDIPPFTLSFARWSLACLIVLPLAAKQLRADLAVLLQHWPVVLALGVIGVGGFNAFLYSGLHYTTATNSLLLQAAIPAMVLLLDRIIYGTRPLRPQILGVGLSTLGVLAIIFQGDLAAIAGLHFGRGDVLVMCGVLAWSIYTALLRRRPPVDAVSLLAATFVIGAVTMVPLAATEWTQAMAIDWRPGVIAAIAYVAILPSVVAYFLYNLAVAKIGPGKAGQAISLMPLFGALLAMITLNEALHGYHIAGMALILGGIATTALAGRGDAGHRTQDAGLSD